MKKKLLLLVSIPLICFIFYKINYNSPDLPCTQEYVTGTNNIQGEVDPTYFSNTDIAFQIGANQKGQAVFKNPQKAFKIFKSKYNIELKKIQKTFNLLALNQINFSSYGNYAWQITDINSKEEQERYNFITSFIDIYENSFN